ncbi:MAG: DNA-3-methyladenine glycosylase I [Methylococcaceae bacterium]|jgi:3-methyladenine DNA glycosylase Tag
MTAFARILARAEQRKGGAEALNALLPPVPDKQKLANVPDSRLLAEITKRIFCSGFSWKVIENKWPGFEAAFLSFEPSILIYQPNEFWDALLNDTRIVRNGIKIFATRHNAAFVQEISQQYGSFGKLLAQWPSHDEIGLLQLLAKQGSRLGGQSGQTLLRFVGWDGFITSKDVVTCLRDAGLDIAAEVKSKGDMAKVQQQFNIWAAETGLPYVHLSRICALSIGENSLENGYKDEI